MAIHSTACATAYCTNASRGFLAIAEFLVYIDRLGRAEVLSRPPIHHWEVTQEGILKQMKHLHTVSPLDAK